jgi:hypothetical protein
MSWQDWSFGCEQCGCDRIAATARRVPLFRIAALETTKVTTNWQRAKRPRSKWLTIEH